MPPLTLWKIELSPPANTVRALADMLGLKLDLIDVDFDNMEHKSSKILKLNPLGTVPILKDGDFVLTDSHAQMKYLISKYGTSAHNNLYPSDIETRAIVDQGLFLDTGIIFIRGTVVALPAMTEGLKAPSERQLQDIEGAYEMLEAYIGDKKFMAADHLTIADLSLGASTLVLTGIKELDKKKYPRIAAWLERLFKVPQFNKYVTNGNKVLTQVLKECWAKNNAAQ